MKRGILFLTVVLLSLSQTAMAEDVAIGSVSDWQNFAARVNAGDTNLNAYLTQDVDLGDDQTMVGTADNLYRGRFNGRGYTLTIHYTPTEDVCAPFRYTAAMKITALHVAGTINTAYKYAGGVVGHTSSDDGRIHNCRSSVAITSSVSGQGGHGGIVADENYCDIYMSNCLFDGSIQTTNGTTDCGGLIGFHSRYVNMYNCLYAPSAESVNSGGTLAYPTTPDWININNSYYTSTMGAEQGTSAVGMSAEELAQKLGTMWEVVDGKPVPIMSQRPLSGNGTEASPYTINNVADWKNFCANINNGESYSGKYVAMMQDVDLGDQQIMAGMPELVLGEDLLAIFLFKGTFDGKNHTLTVNYTSAEQYCAPFRYIESATIKNLYTAGTIETSAVSSAGIVGGIYGNATSSTIDNCRSSIVLTSSVNGEGKHGGIVGSQIGPGVTINIKNSLFDGKLLTTNGTTNCGGILGYVGWRGTIENSAYAPQTLAEGETPITAGSNTIGRYYVDNNRRLTLNNCYYGAKMETLQGDPIARSITGDDGIDVTINDLPQVTICGEKFYASGTQVKLAYSGTEAFNHYELNIGAISNVFSQGGTHTLTDIYGDVIISVSTEEGEREMYISYDDNVATYYYDSQRAHHALTGDPNKRGEDYSPIKPEAAKSPYKVVIDPSMADARPVTETCGMFFFGTIGGGDAYFVTEIEGLEYLNTSEAVSLMGMFYYSRVKDLDLSHFDTRKVTNMNNMFYMCTNLTFIDFGDNFNTSNVTSMKYMFSECRALKCLDLSSFETHNVTNTAYMFANCYELTTVCVDGNKWDMSNMQEDESFDHMLSYCRKIVGGKGTSWENERNWGVEMARIDGGPNDPGYFWDVNDLAVQPYVAYDTGSKTLYFRNDMWKGKMDAATKVYDVPSTNHVTPWFYDYGREIERAVFDHRFADVRPTSTSCWFLGNDNLKSVSGIEYLNTSEVTDMSSMFSGCYMLKSIDVSGFNTEKVTNMSAMFSECKLLTNIDVSGFNTENVTDMFAMFSSCENVKALDVSGFNTAKVTRMSSMFSGCNALTALDVSGFNTENVTDMSLMFKNLNVETLALSGFNTAKVINFERMFIGCTKMQSIDVTHFNTANAERLQEMFKDCSSLTAVDVSGFDVRKAQWMEGMFSGCSALKTIDLSSLDLSNYYSLLDDMFNGCTSLESIDLSGLNTSHVKSFYRTFMNCTSLTMLDLGSFDTSSTTSMSDMFYGCSSLKTIFASEAFVTTNITSQYGGIDMFKGCTSIVGGMGTTYQGDSYETDRFAQIDGGESNKGYFTHVKDKFYAAYDAETHTITFLGDGRRSEHAVIYNVDDFFNETEDKHVEWQKAVFDASFAKLKPQNVAGWFAECTSLKEIVGLENLNLSETFIMGFLFNNCSALTVLDLSKLDINRPTYKTSMLAGLNPECVLYVPSGMTVADLEGDDDLHCGLVHESYNLVLDTDGDGQYDCADLRLKDATDYPIVTPFHAAKALYQRNFTSGRRATIYLPFAFSTTQFGKIYDFEGLLAENGGGIRFYPVAGATTTANIPYIIDPNGTQIEAINVDVLATCDTEPTGANEMIGVCRRGRVPVGAYSFDATNGLLKHVAANSGVVNISAFRAYFLLPEADAAGSKTIEAIFEDDTPTAITVPDAVDTKAEWYTVNGQRLPGRPNKKGIYIVNGKKYVVK